MYKDMTTLVLILQIGKDSEQAYFVCNSQFTSEPGKFNIYISSSSGLIHFFLDLY